MSALIETLRNTVSALVPHSSLCEPDGWQPFIGNLSQCVNTFLRRNYVYVELATCKGVVGRGDAVVDHDEFTSPETGTSFRGFPFLSSQSC